jgi:hypothetical protein
VRGAKTEAAGVALDVQDADDLRRTYERMAAGLGDLMASVVVQSMVPPGHDVAVSLAPAPIVGAAVEIGPGGAVAALVGPTARAVLPLTDVATEDLIARSSFGAALQPPDARALADVVARVAHLGEEVPGVVALELNPVIVGGGAAWCTDVTVEIAPTLADPAEATRRLPP